MGASAGQWALAPFTMGASLLPEDTRSGIPLIGPLTGAKSDEQRALEATQQRLAGEQQQRMEQQRQVGMQNLANRLAAFAPMNNHLASRGMQAYSPQQMQQMAADPSGGPQASGLAQRWMQLSNQERDLIRSGAQGGQGAPAVGNLSPEAQLFATMPMARILEIDQQAATFGQQQGAEQRRQTQVGAAFANAPSGPAPIQMSTPAAARRF